MAVSGLPGGMIDPNAGGAIRPPVGGGQPVARPGVAQPGIANGTVVEGLVTNKEGEAYTVRIGAQTLSARSTIPLFVGQRFRAVWDSSSAPPMLRLQQSDMALLARFGGRDQPVAFALLSRGLPVGDNVLLAIRQSWMQTGADPAKLGVLAELWARNLPMNETNIALFAWYMALTPAQAMEIWKKIRDRMRTQKFSSPGDLLDAIRGDGDPDVKRFLRAHALAGKPARKGLEKGLDPAMLLAPAWWPVDDAGGEPAMARVSFSSEERRGRHVWWLNFELEGESLGPVRGDVMTNGHAISVNIRLRDESKVPFVEENLPALRDDLSEVALPVQHLGVAPYRQDGRFVRAGTVGLDMEI